MTEINYKCGSCGDTTSADNPDKDWGTKTERKVTSYLCGRCKWDIQYAEKTGPWIETYSGRRIYFYDLTPYPDSISLEDIAHSLSMIARFAGHTKEHYSVGKHVLFCYEMARQGLPEPNTSLVYYMNEPS